jgi:hypothetical protein
MPTRARAAIRQREGNTMRKLFAVATAIGLLALTADPALADSPSARDIQAAVDSYLADDVQDVNLVGGPGSAGYDSGFWIKGGDFSLKTNVTLQARYEAWLWDSSVNKAAQPENSLGDQSGFALPRATVKFSGTAPCNISYYLELEFGHHGYDSSQFNQNTNLGPLHQTNNFDHAREAWIQWSSSDMFNFRMGTIATAATRQLMTAPELQQFVDIALASAYVGSIMPGYTDRNRDHGFALHGAFGCNNEWSYLLTVTNGDGGDSVRNILDYRTSDNLAFSARLNWAFLNAIGYQEGALRQQTCQWYGEVGAWGYYYADRRDLAHTHVADSWRAGADLALGYGGFSFTGGITLGEDSPAAGTGFEHLAYLAQLGYHFPGTAWELAVRYSAYDVTNTAGFAIPATSQHPLGNGSVSEIAFGVNYYLNGHGNKMQVDVALVSGSDATSQLLADVYTGYPGNNVGAGGNQGQGGNDYGMLIRFQWQLAL